MGLALFCPITTRVKGYPFEVVLPDGGEAKGAILADQIESLDWRARRATRFDVVGDETLAHVLGKIGALVGGSTDR